jgi:hypothetical protein
MENIFKICKRGIIAILTLCILLGIAGAGLNVTAMAAETTATVEETAVATEEITTVVVEESTISTEEPTVATEENTQELVPMMATRCYDPLTSYFGSGYTVTSTSGPWQYISGAGGITGAYNTSTGYGYVQMSDGTRSPFQI